MHPEEGNQTLLSQLHQAHLERDHVERQLADASSAQLSSVNDQGFPDSLAPGDKKGRCRMMSGAVLIVVGLLAAVIALGVMQPWVSNAPATPAPSTAPTALISKLSPAPAPSIAPTALPSSAPTPPPAPSVPVIDLLSLASSDGGVALRTSGAPQNQAHEWILSDMNGRKQS